MAKLNKQAFLSFYAFFLVVDLSVFIATSLENKDTAKWRQKLNLIVGFLLLCIAAAKIYKFKTQNVLMLDQVSIFSLYCIL